MCYFKEILSARRKAETPADFRASKMSLRTNFHLTDWMAENILRNTAEVGIIELV